MGTRGRSKGPSMKIWKALVILALVAPLAYRLSWRNPRKVDSSGKTIVRYMAWGYPSQLNTEQKLIDAFNAANPDLQVTFIMAPMFSYYDKVQLMLATGTGPDVLRTNPEHFKRYIRLGYFRDLEPFMAADPGYHAEDFFKISRDAALYNGRHHGIGILLTKTLIYYNKTLFDEAGIEDPWQRYRKGQWTWDDYLEVAKLLTKTDESGRPIFGMSFPGNVYQAGTLIRAHGGDYLSPDGKKCLVNTPEAVDGVQWLKDLRWKWHVAPTPSQMALSVFSFESGRIAMELDSSGESPRLRDAIKDFRWDVAPCPRGDYDNGAGYGSHILVMNTGTKVPDAAWRFMRFMNGPEAETLLGVKLRRCIPSRRALAFSKEYLSADQSPFNMGAFVADIDAPQREFPYDERWLEWTDELTSHLDQVWLDLKPTKQVLDEAAVRVDMILNGETD